MRVLHSIPFIREIVERKGGKETGYVAETPAPNPQKKSQDHPK